MITEKELQDIREEAEKLYPWPEADVNFKKYYETMERICRYQREAHITAATAERLRAKGLVRALEEMIKQFKKSNNLWNDMAVIEQSEYTLNNYNQNK